MLKIMLRNTKLIMLIVTVKFNTLKLYSTYNFLLIMQSVDSMIPVLSIFFDHSIIHINSLFNLLTLSLQIH